MKSEEKTKFNLKLLITIIIPILFVVALIFKFEYYLHYGKKWELSISGYDPRDLLMGRYLRFKVNWNWKDKKNLKILPNYNCCVLLEKNNNTNKNPIVSLVPCDKFKDKDIIRTAVSENYFYRQPLDLNIGIERYYIPEKYGKKLENLLRAKPASIIISVASGGKTVVIDDLLINGKSWRTYVDK